MEDLLSRRSAVLAVRLLGRHLHQRNYPPKSLRRDLLASVTMNLSATPVGMKDRDVEDQWRFAGLSLSAQPRGPAFPNA
jgi:hypothetical protein